MAHVISGIVLVAVFASVAGGCALLVLALVRVCRKDKPGRQAEH